MKHATLALVIAGALSIASTGAHAAGPDLGSLLGNSALASLGVPAAATAGNAAGVIGYCVQNNYIQANKAKAEQVKDQLLGKLGMPSKQKEPKDPGYLSGLAGTITGSNGQTFNIDKLKGNLREKACDFVLDNATNLL